MKNKTIKVYMFLIIIVMLITGCKIQSVEDFNQGEIELNEDITKQNTNNKEKDEEIDRDIAKSDKEDKVETEKDNKDNLDNDNKEVNTKKEDSKKDNNNDNEKNKNESKDKPKTENKAKEIEGNNKELLSKQTDFKPEKKPVSPSITESKPIETSKPVNTPKVETPKPESPKPENPKPVEPLKPVEPPKKPEPVKKYATIDIRVDQLLKSENYEKLDDKVKKFVSSDGVIMGKTSIEIQDGDTVFDILVKAVAQKEIHMSYQGSGGNQYGSAYIQGINNIYEFDGGELSGWMYKVDGSYPDHGVSAYKIEEGQHISFNYTCDLGRDLGREMK